MTKIIDQCPICEGDFMFDPSREDNLIREIVVNDFGETQPMFICPDCLEERMKATDVNVNGHVLCAVKGCANDAGQSRYCLYHADEMYGNKNETEPEMRY